MGIMGFLQNVASNFVNHYQELSSRIGQTDSHTKIAAIPAPTARTETPVDRYEPSSESAINDSDKSKKAHKSKDHGVKHADSDHKAHKKDHDHHDKHDSIAPSTADTKKPDATYSFQRKAELNYKLDLEFNLAALQRTAASIEDGEITSFEQLSAAGFGLHADFQLSGQQFVRSTMPESETDTPQSRQALTVARSRQASAFRATSRNFAVESFFNESSKLKRFSSNNEADGVRQTVNKFAFRFRSDSTFSFGHLERFNVQSNRVADEMPDAFGSYMNSAGDVAANGSNDMMATFFDAVDQYLDGAEESLLQKTISAFDAAAAELGFEGVMVDAARDQLVSTIEGFFDRVDTAVASIQSNFVAPDMIQPTMPIGDPAILNVPDTGIAQQQPYVATA